jgi:hypothetical protein
VSLSRTPSAPPTGKLLLTLVSWFSPPTFRLPSRITLTDSKRESWFSDLANPAVPLSKLSRSVPHGYKGEKGLDMLAARKVEIGRAVWFVRAFGGVEIVSIHFSSSAVTMAGRVRLTAFIFTVAITRQVSSPSDGDLAVHIGIHDCRLRIRPQTASQSQPLQQRKYHTDYSHS